MERKFGSTGVALLAAASFCISAHAFLVSPLRALADERGPNPEVVFSQVHVAYAQESRDRTVHYERRYFSAVVNAGRAYARLRPSDNEYGKLALLTVQIGSALHYDPLTDRAAAPWYVREAALWVSKNSKDIKLVRSANDLVVRVDAMNEDLPALAKYADADAAALIKEHPHETDIRLLQAEADWRAWVLTNDPSWRDLAITRAAKEGVSAEKLPEIIAHKASAEIADLVANSGMSPLAPADEYFGHMNYSMLGIENTERHINEKIDNGEDPASQESLALLVADSICDMQKTYPADTDMTKLLFEGYTLLNRVATPAATTTANKIRTLLTVEYQDAPESTQLLQTTTATTNSP